MEIKTDYLNQVYNLSEFVHTVKKTVAKARQIMTMEEYDSIAFTGTSGAAMAYILSAELGVHLICIRKATDSSHYVRGHGQLEGNVSAKRYLFVDDFISSGTTFRTVREFIKNKMPKAECIGGLMYAATRGDYNFHDYLIYTTHVEEGTQLHFPQIMGPNW
jgi:adenine/guanine phosphoribosyltransferase-like PRPP-binding protein